MATKANQKASSPVQSAQNAVAVPQAGGAVALPPDLAAELAAYAKDDAARERPKVARISLKSGIMSYQGDDMPNNLIECVVVGGAYRNVYYEGAYDSDNIVNPTCYSLSDSGKDMVPNEGVESRQGDDCSSCKWAQWGSGKRSDGKPSKGKACKQTRRVMIIPADALQSVEDVKNAEMAILDVPVTSVAHYANFVNVLNTTLNRPVWAVVTTIKVVPSKKNQFEVTFTPTKSINDAEVLRAVMARRDDALRIALMPYEGSGGEKDPEAGQPKAESKIGKKF